MRRWLRNREQRKRKMKSNSNCGKRKASDTAFTAYDAAIIGAGASGLAAAITLKQENPKVSVVLIEKKEAPGKKLSITGNGRCNLSNTACENNAEVLAFFGECGILVREDEEGRLYPYSEDAKEVVSLLTTLAEAAGVEILVNHEIRRVEAEPEGGFLLFVDGMKAMKAKKVLIATGGKSYPQTGTTGDGFVIARSFGHQVKSPAPGLTAICVAQEKTDSENDSAAAEMKFLKGVRAKGCVRLFVCEERGAQGKALREREIFCESGEVQFREDSISGICIMNMSSFIKPQGSPAAAESFGAYTIRIDLAPDFSAEQLEEHIRIMVLRRDLTAGDLLKTIAKEKLAKVILARAGVHEDMPAEKLSEAEKKRIAAGVKKFSLHVTGLKGWKEAQVTCGGVALDEVGAETMESALVPGLYFSGEVLDYAGPCGGFNLHHAWLTGVRAGRAMAESLKREIE